MVYICLYQMYASLTNDSMKSLLLHLKKSIIFFRIEIGLFKVNYTNLASDLISLDR